MNMFAFSRSNCPLWQPVTEVRAHLQCDMELAKNQRELLTAHGEVVAAFYRSCLRAFSAKLEAAVLLASGMLVRGEATRVTQAAVAAGAPAALLTWASVSSEAWANSPLRAFRLSAV